MTGYDKDYEEFRVAWNNLVVVVATELGLVKVLNWLNKFLTKF